MDPLHIFNTSKEKHGIHSIELIVLKVHTFINRILVSNLEGIKKCMLRAQLPQLCLKYINENIFEIGEALNS